MKIVTQYTTQLEKSQQLILDLSEVKKYLKVDYDDDDELISTLIRSSQEEVEGILSKDLLHKKWKQDVDLVLDNCDYDFNFSFPVFSYSTIKIPLTHKPILEVCNVMSSIGELDRDDYSVALMDIPHLYIKTKAIIGTARKGVSSIGITYKTGMYKTNEEIPARIKLCIMMLVANKYMQRDFVQPGIYSAPTKNIKSLLRSFIDYRIA